MQHWAGLCSTARHWAGLDHKNLLKAQVMLESSASSFLFETVKQPAAELIVIDLFHLPALRKIAEITRMIANTMMVTYLGQFHS